MAMYSAVDGLPNDFHLVHLGARALGGAGLIFSEMTCVSPEGRITRGCTGIYTEEQARAWQRIVSFVHDQSTAKIAMQLGHSGRKGSTGLPWEAPDGGDVPLDAGGWETVGPSALAWDAQHRAPREMSEPEMATIRDQFVAAAKRVAEAGFDMIELHCAHGYLLSSFISPITNQRSDHYGGSLENRMRYPLEVLGAVRAVWPGDRPMSVRISATDWVPGGITVEDAVTIAAMFREHGADLIDVSAGQVTPDQKPVYGRMFQVPFAESIRLETGMKTMAVGNIYEPDHVNSILGAGRADLCLLARPHLWDPQWTHRAAAQLGYEDVQWPNQYLSGKQQLEVLERRAREAQTGPI
jgi:anthraniloyl-CoA monooxygenase